MQSSDLEMIAGKVDALATGIAGVGEPAIRLSGAETWIGPAADDAKVALAGVTRATGDAAVELHQVARMLRARAAEVAAQEAAARAAAEGGG